MKISLTLALLILCAAGLAGWPAHERIAALKQACQRSSTDSDRLDRLAKGLYRDSGQGLVSMVWRPLPDEKTRWAEAVLNLEFQGFSAAELRALLVRVDLLEGSVSMEQHDNASFKVIWTMANKYPQDCLDMAPQIASRPMGRGFLLRAIASLAIRNPDAAIDWLKLHSREIPELADTDARGLIFRDIAKEDPELALSLAPLLKAELTALTMQTLAEAAESPRQYDFFLEAIRKHWPELAKAEEQTSPELAAVHLAAGVMKHDFQRSSAWIEANYSLKQQSVIASYPVVSGATFSEYGPWLDWFRERAPAREYPFIVQTLIQDWSYEDWPGAALWLAKQPEGTARKEGAIMLSGLVATVNLEEALKIARLIRDDSDRRQAYKEILFVLKGFDAAAAGKFAAEYGLTPR